MTERNLTELEEMAWAAKDDLWQQAGNVGREPKIYLHWSAGRYEQVFEDYHINITGDGAIIVTTDDLSDVKSHTWHRNTGSIGVSLCCACGANTQDLGDYPPTAQQIETMARVIAVLATALALPIDRNHIMTHGEAADNEDGEEIHEPYGPKTDCERWDLEYLGTDESPVYNPWDTDGNRGGDVLRGKAYWYVENGTEEG